jgi:hypothetical protein
MFAPRRYARLEPRNHKPACNRVHILDELVNCGTLQVGMTGDYLLFTFVDRAKTEPRVRQI